jgi:hypothetical protein
VLHAVMTWTEVKSRSNTAENEPPTPIIIVAVVVLCDVKDLSIVTRHTCQSIGIHVSHEYVAAFTSST